MTTQGLRLDGHLRTFASGNLLAIPRHNRVRQRREAAGHDIDARPDELHRAVPEVPHEGLTQKDQEEVASNGGAKRFAGG